MAQITGSSTIDWSSISLSQVNFETDIVTFVNRVDQIFTDLGITPPENIVSRSPTSIVVNLVSGGRLTLGGSGFDGTSPLIINSFNFNNPPNGTGEVIRWAGTLDGIGKEFFTSSTIGSTGFSETIKGNIIIPATFPTSGNITATLTSLVVKIGSAKVTIGGNFNLTGDLVSSSLTGTVTGISVVSGTNTIKMTGLSLPLDVVEAALVSDDLANVNDLFSFVGNQMPGNDTITYNSTLGVELFGGAGNDTITGGTGPDTLHGGTDNDILIGGLGEDTVNGDAGDDRITMLVTAGNVDTLDAGADTDTLVLRGVVPGDHEVVVDLSSSTDQVVSIGGVLDDTLDQINFENLNSAGIGSSVTVTGSDGDNVIIGSSGNDSLDGGAGNDTITGGAGSDTLDGGTDNDTLIGGTGNDTYTVDSVGDVVTEVLIAGTDKVLSSIDYTLGANVENLELTGSALNGTGNGLANVLTGNNGVNILTGGVGNDTYIVQNDADSVVENFNTDIDLVQSAAASFTLNANVEKLTLIGITDINGTGNVLANVITGNSGHNTLSGEAGSDKLIGGDGDDLLLGGLGNDILIGGNGVDNLDGGAGPDNMAGGTNDDTYTVDSIGDVVTEVLIAGTDKVLSSIDYTLGANVENLELTGSALNGTGNALANVLTGNNGVNILTGGVGNDQLLGEDGNDTLLGGLGQDTVNGGAGDDRITLLVTAGNVDTIDAGADTDTLVLSGVVPGNHVVEVNLSLVDQVVSIGGELDDALAQVNFENLTASGLGSSVTVTGSDGDNIIIGSNGNDSIDGGAGIDTLNGGLGADNLQGDVGDDLFLLASTAHFAASEIINGEDDTDTLRYTGNAAATLTLTNLVTNIEQVEIANATGDPTGIAAINVNAAAVASGLTILGNNGANVLTGTSQADTLTGNGGNDTLRGRLGNDTYLVNRGDGRDRISENDSTGGNSDTVLYGATINPLDLVLSRQVNDLRIALDGTTERVTIQNWYANPTTAQVETIQAGNGDMLLNTQVQGLIDAMAQFTTDTGLSWDAASGGAGDPGQQAQFQGILAANWQS